MVGQSIALPAFDHNSTYLSKLIDGSFLCLHAIFGIWFKFKVFVAPCRHVLITRYGIGCCRVRDRKLVYFGLGGKKPSTSSQCRHMFRSEYRCRRRRRGLRMRRANGRTSTFPLSGIGCGRSIVVTVCACPRTSLSITSIHSISAWHGESLRPTLSFAIVVGKFRHNSTLTLDPLPYGLLQVLDSHTHVLLAKSCDNSVCAETDRRCRKLTVVLVFRHQENVSAFAVRFCQPDLSTVDVVYGLWIALQARSWFGLLQSLQPLSAEVSTY